MTDVGIVLTNLLYLIVALAVAIVGALVVVLRHRKPKSVEANVASFHRGLRALAPDSPTEAASTAPSWGGARNRVVTPTTASADPAVAPPAGPPIEPPADDSAVAPDEATEVPPDEAGVAEVAVGSEEAPPSIPSKDPPVAVEVDVVDQVPTGPLHFAPRNLKKRRPVSPPETGTPTKEAGTG